MATASNLKKLGEKLEALVDKVSDSSFEEVWKAEGKSFYKSVAGLFTGKRKRKEKDANAPKNPLNNYLHLLQLGLSEILDLA